MKEWWRKLHERPMAYVWYYDGSGAWEFNPDVFSGQPILATAIARRTHWWQSGWNIDQETIVVKEQHEPAN